MILYKCQEGGDKDEGEKPETANKKDGPTTNDRAYRFRLNQPSIKFLIRLHQEALRNLIEQRGASAKALLFPSD